MNYLGHIDSISILHPIVTPTNGLSYVFFHTSIQCMGPPLDVADFFYRLNHRSIRSNPQVKPLHEMFHHMTKKTSKTGKNWETIGKKTPKPQKSPGFSHVLPCFTCRSKLLGLTVPMRAIPWGGFTGDASSAARDDASLLGGWG